MTTHIITWTDKHEEQLILIQKYSKQLRIKATEREIFLQCEGGDIWENFGFLFKKMKVYIDQCWLVIFLIMKKKI